MEKGFHFLPPGSRLRTPKPRTRSPVFAALLDTEAYCVPRNSSEHSGCRLTDTSRQRDCQGTDIGVVSTNTSRLPNINSDQTSAPRMKAFVVKRRQPPKAETGESRACCMTCYCRRNCRARRGGSISSQALQTITYRSPVNRPSSKWKLSKKLR